MSKSDDDREKTTQPITTTARSSSSDKDKTPAKPPGILLTPGTGTAKRKRVTFGRDVKQGSGGRDKPSTSGLPDDCPGKFPSPWVDRSTDGSSSRPKTRLQLAMENARKNSRKGGVIDGKDFDNSEDADWDEEDDETDDADDSGCDTDVTVDLAEPKSRSGKYWKAYFETYHADAKAEMEKLIKYKHLAKSYAKKKDAEALELSQKLSEEQEKSKALEEKVAELTRQLNMAGRGEAGGNNAKLVDELEEQRALAAEYKKQLEALETLLEDETNDAADGRSKRRIASPKTQKTLLEAQRELRKARTQIRELQKLQEERDKLRSQLRYVEQRASKLEEENSKLTKELSQSKSKLSDLEKRLAESNNEYETLKENAKARYIEAKQVCDVKNETIAKLRAEIDALKKDGTDAERVGRSAATSTTEEKTATSRAGLSETRHRERHGLEGYRRTTSGDRVLPLSRASTSKTQAEVDAKLEPADDVLSDRGNLQDSRSSASSGRSAHARDDDDDVILPSRTTYTITGGRSLNQTSTITSEKRSVDDLHSRRTSTTARPSATTLSKSNQSSRPLSPPSDSEEEQAKPSTLRSRLDRLGSRVGISASRSVAATSAAPAADSSVMFNTTRTSLPADRASAARARLELKRQERLRERERARGLMRERERERGLAMEEKENAEGY